MECCGHFIFPVTRARCFLVEDHSFIHSSLHSFNNKCFMLVMFQIGMYISNGNKRAKGRLAVWIRTKGSKKECVINSAWLSTEKLNRGEHTWELVLQDENLRVCQGNNKEEHYRQNQSLWKEWNNERLVRGTVNSSTYLESPRSHSLCCHKSWVWT